ncbi:hypothetical protein LJK88_03320 [Paenibacillus sp. P26]|nr:hypothetical protein LJK88_03320 [Paenibacillus sp. P26]
MGAWLRWTGLLCLCAAAWLFAVIQGGRTAWFLAAAFSLWAGYAMALFWLLGRGSRLVVQPAKAGGRPVGGPRAFGGGGGRGGTGPACAGAGP